MEPVKLINSIGEINELYKFIKHYSLDYPNYEQWLRKCKRELELGYKKAFVYKKNNEIIGNLIFQPHKQDHSLLELKNGRVIEKYRNLGIFNLLVNSVENYAIQNNFKRMIADTHNQDVVTILQKKGFKIISKETLYIANRQEIILAKDLNPLELKLI